MKNDLKFSKYCHVDIFDIVRKYMAQCQKELSKNQTYPKISLTAYESSKLSTFEYINSQCRVL